MKKVLLSLGAAMLLAVGAQAQTGFGLKAGVNLPSYNYGSSDQLSDTKSAVNFHVTGYLNADLGSFFAIQPGVSLQGKGAKFIEVKDNVISNTTYDYSENTMWLEIPVNLIAKVPLAERSNIFIGAGPYAGFGLSGKRTLNSTNGDGDFSSSTLKEFKFGKDERLKGLDYGVNVLAGVKLNGLLLNANYGLGLNNIAGSKSVSNNIKNRVLSFGVGFEF